VLAAVPPKREAHRALGDIRESIAELAYYRSTIFIGDITAPSSR
jgi:oligoribonuclease